MLLIDLLFLLVLVGFGAIGFWLGAIHTLGSLVGTLLGAVLASRWYLPAAVFVTSITGWKPPWLGVITFALLFVLINRSIGYLAGLLDKGSSLLRVVPGFQLINQGLGLVLGLVEGAMTLGLILTLTHVVNLGEPVSQQLQESKIAPVVERVASILLPLVPDSFIYIDEGLQRVEDSAAPRQQEL